MNEIGNNNPTLESQLGHQFTDQGLLCQALTHRSYSSVHNERLEFLGDSILSLTISVILYERFPSAKEGEMSRMRANLVKGETLTHLAKMLGLGDHLLLGSGELKTGGRNRDSILADTMEALIGALYCDAGLAMSQAFIKSVFASHLSKLDLKTQSKDGKTRLQEYLQARKQALPDYQVIKTSGKEHARRFVIECRVTLLDTVCEGRGSSRREAEQQAAEATLVLLAKQ